MPLACSRGDAGLRGIDQSPLDSRFPVMITWLFFMILTSYFVNNAIQSSSHSLAREIKVPVLRSSSTKASCEVAFSAGDRCSCPLSWVGIALLLATRMVGPVAVGTRWTRSF